MRHAFAPIRRLFAALALVLPLAVAGCDDDPEPMGTESGSSTDGSTTDDGTTTGQASTGVSATINGTGNGSTGDTDTDTDTGTSTSTSTGTGTGGKTTFAPAG